MASDEQLRALFDGISNDDVERIKKCLDAGVSMDAMLDYTHCSMGGKTPLHYAFEYQHYKAARFLIERGANVNQRGYRGRTPIFRLLQNIYSGGGWGWEGKGGSGSPEWAVFIKTWNEQRFDMLNYLISKGASVSIQDEDDLTPLHFTVNAATHGGMPETQDQRITAAEVLLQAGADVNGGVPKPLRYARSYQDYALAKVFERHGGKD